MTDRTELEQLIYRSISAVRKVPANELGPDTALFGQGKAILDSFSLVQLIFELERNVREITHREIKFTMEQLLAEKDNPFHTVRSLQAFLAKTLGDERDA